MNLVAENLVVIGNCRMTGIPDEKHFFSFSLLHCFYNGKITCVLIAMIDCFRKDIMWRNMNLTLVYLISALHDFPKIELGCFVVFNGLGLSMIGTIKIGCFSIVIFIREFQ